MRYIAKQSHITLVRIVEIKIVNGVIVPIKSAAERMMTCILVTASRTSRSNRNPLNGILALQAKKINIGCKDEILIEVVDVVVIYPMRKQGQLFGSGNLIRIVFGAISAGIRLGVSAIPCIQAHGGHQAQKKKK